MGIKFKRLVLPLTLLGLAATALMLAGCAQPDDWNARMEAWRQYGDYWCKSGQDKELMFGKPEDLFWCKMTYASKFPKPEPLHPVYSLTDPAYEPGPDLGGFATIYNNRGDAVGSITYTPY